MVEWSTFCQFEQHMSDHRHIYIHCLIYLDGVSSLKDHTKSEITKRTRYLKWYSLYCQTTIFCISFDVQDNTRLGLEPTINHTRGGHCNYYTTDEVSNEVLHTNLFRWLVSIQVGFVVGSSSILVTPRVWLIVGSSPSRVTPRVWLIVGSSPSRVKQKTTIG
jgi:hypothetical protein